jgi:hypothetical protein
MPVTGPITWRWFEPGILSADTITKLPDGATGAVVVSGSHGGRYPGYLAVKAGVRAVIFNDAGIGRNEAGVGSLLYLQALGIAAATVAHTSCLIGDACDMLARGRISRANAEATAVGVVEGEACAEAARRLVKASRQLVEPPYIGENRDELWLPGARHRILLLDSASLVRPDDAGEIIVTGSHGGLIGGDPALALRTDGFAAVFNDAGRSDGPGTSRLPALDRRGIAAVTVAASSASIGDAASTFCDGIISAANGAASRWGARPGDPLRICVSEWASMNKPAA